MYKDYNNDYYNRREMRERADYDLRSRGLVRDEFGHYDDPNDPCRTGAYIDPEGNIHYDM